MTAISGVRALSLKYREMETEKNINKVISASHISIYILSVPLDKAKRQLLECTVYYQYTAAFWPFLLKKYRVKNKL